MLLQRALRCKKNNIRIISYICMHKYIFININRVISVHKSLFGCVSAGVAWFIFQSVCTHFCNKYSSKLMLFNFSTLSSTIFLVKIHYISLYLYLYVCLKIGSIAAEHFQHDIPNDNHLFKHFLSFAFFTDNISIGIPQQTKTKQWAKRYFKSTVLFLQRNFAHSDNKRGVTR